MMMEYWTAEIARDHLDALSQLLQNVVEDGASIGFLPPLPLDEARAYWQGVLPGIEQGTRWLLAAREADLLVGAAQLALETRANALHRAEVQKLMVHTAFRRRGLADRLMAALEQRAQEAGRTLLVLDTRQGDPSEQLYQKRGYVLAGVIPQYVRSADGAMDSTMLYYKLLA